MNLLHPAPTDTGASLSDLAQQLEESIEGLDYARSLGLVKALRHRIDGPGRGEAEPTPGGELGLDLVPE